LLVEATTWTGGIDIGSRPTPCAWIERRVRARLATQTSRSPWIGAAPAACSARVGITHGVAATAPAEHRLRGALAPSHVRGLRISSSAGE
jgi:hypothetical protein